MGPLPVMTAAFAAGLAWAGIFLPPIPSRVMLAAACAAAVVAALLWARRVRFASVAVLGACALSGLLAGTRLPPVEMPPEALEALQGGEAVLEARVSSPGRETEFGMVFQARPLQLLSRTGDEALSGSALPARLRIILTCGKAPEGLDEGAGILLKRTEPLTDSLSGLRNPDAPETSSPSTAGLKVKERNLLVIPREPHGLALLRNRVSQKLGAALSRESALFSEAVTLGRPGRMPPELADAFRRSGLAHLLAVSGLHLSVLSLLVTALLTALFSRIPPLASRLPAAWIAGMAGIPFIWSYALFASAGPPVLRAALMVTACFLARLAGRRSVMPSVLALAALCILTAQPGALAGPSFILSFSAVAGIFIFSRRIGRMLLHGVLRFPSDDSLEKGRFKTAVRRAAGFLADLAGVSAAASLATLPALCIFFGRVPLAGVACNLAAVPVFSFLVLPANLLFCASLLAGAPIPGAAAAFMDWINVTFLRLVGALAGVVDPLALSPWAAWPAAALVTAALALAAARKKTAAGLLMIPLGLILLVPPLWTALRRNVVTQGRLTVVFADVGQGDATLVRTPEGLHLLVDTGPGPGERFAAWIRTWTRRIDLLVITHGHDDHYGGSAALLREGIDVGRVWINPQGLEEKHDPGYLALIESFRKGGTITAAGPPCGLSMLGSLAVRVLAPCEPGGYDYLLDWNNNSIVLHLAYGRAGFLLTGDIEKEGEGRLAAHGDLKAQVIKVPHHGSSGSSSGTITGWPGVGMAVVTAGQGNPFGFPHLQVISDFEKRGARIVRVDADGAALFITDGVSLSVRDYRWREKLNLALH